MCPQADETPSSDAPCCDRRLYMGRLLVILDYTINDIWYYVVGITDRIVRFIFVFVSWRMIIYN